MLCACVKSSICTCVTNTFQTVMQSTYFQLYVSMQFKELVKKYVLLLSYKSTINEVIILCCFSSSSFTFYFEPSNNEELHSVYCSPNILRVIKSRRLRWAGHVARMEEGRSVFKMLTGKPTGKRPLGRPRRRWEDNIRMDHEEIGINAGN